MAATCGFEDSYFALWTIRYAKNYSTARHGARGKRITRGGEEFALDVSLDSRYCPK